MDRLGMLSENERRHLPRSLHTTKPRQAKTYNQRPKGRLARKNQRRSSSKRAFRHPPAESRPMKENPLEVKRCALQTLGGGSASNTRSPAPLKGDAAYKTQSNEATLNRMKPYGGSMFYDKCYLSSEDEREAEDDEKGSWALSPSDVGALLLPATASSKRKNSTASSSRPICSTGTKRRKAGDTDEFFRSLVEPDGSSSSDSQLDLEDDDEDSEESEQWRVKTDINTTKRKVEKSEPAPRRPRKPVDSSRSPLQSAMQEPPSSSVRGTGTRTASYKRRLKQASSP